MTSRVNVVTSYHVGEPVVKPATAVWVRIDATLPAVDSRETRR